MASINRTVLFQSRFPMRCVTAVSTGQSSPQAMRVKTVFPLSHLSDLLIAILVIFVVIWPARIVHIVPILNNLLHCPILLPLLSTTTWSLLCSHKIVHIFVIGRYRGPIRDGRPRMSWLGSWRLIQDSCLAYCRRSRYCGVRGRGLCEFAGDCLRLCLLCRNLGPFGWLKS